MSIPIWPVSLPQKIQSTGYSEEMPDNTISSQPDIGPAKVRRRSSSGPRPFQGEIRLTQDELNIFRSFVKNDLRDRVLRFQWTDPLDNTSVVEMRFPVSPSWVMDKGLFVVTLPLEILP